MPLCPTQREPLGIFGVSSTFSATATNNYVLCNSEIHLYFCRSIRAARATHVSLPDQSNWAGPALSLTCAVCLARRGFAVLSNYGSHGRAADVRPDSCLALNPCALYAQAFQILLTTNRRRCSSKPVGLYPTRLQNKGTTKSKRERTSRTRQGFERRQTSKLTQNLLRGGLTHLLPALVISTIGHASLSIRSTVSAPSRGTPHIWTLVTFLPYIV